MSAPTGDDFLLDLRRIPNIAPALHIVAEPPHLPTGRDVHAVHGICSFDLDIEETGSHPVRRDERERQVERGASGEPS